MSQDSPSGPQVTSGLIVKESRLGVALLFLVVTLIATPAGILAVQAWWTGKLFFGISVAGYGALLGVGGIVTGLVSFASLINTFLQRNYLVIGVDCFQQVQYGKVIAQIPFANVSRVDHEEHSLLGKYVRFSLVDRNDRDTIIGGWLVHESNCDFQIFDTGWQMPLESLHEELATRLLDRAGTRVVPASRGTPGNSRASSEIHGFRAHNPSQH
jgi:hypothetical protein